MFKLRSIVPLMAMLLGACTNAGGADVCGPWRAIRVAQADVLSDATARAILAHDETGAALCGWR